MTSTAPSCPAPNRAEYAVRMVLAAVLGMLLCGRVHAKQSDRSQPVNIDASSFDSRAKANGVIHLSGHVVITQGTLKATSDKATAYLDGQSQVKRVVMTGHAHIQQLDDQDKLLTGDAHNIDYDMTRGIAVLTEDVTMHKADTGTITGDKVVYNTNTSQMSAHGAPGKRVHMVFKARPPAARPSAAGTSPKPAAAPASAASAPARAPLPPAAAASAAKGS